MRFHIIRGVEVFFNNDLKWFQFYHWLILEYRPKYGFGLLWVVTNGIKANPNQNYGTWAVPSKFG